MRSSVTLLLALSALVLPVGAQSTGLPVFQSPYRAYSTSETGITFSDPGPGFALEGSYRRTLTGELDAGIRGGLIDGGYRSSNGILVGGDFRLPLIDRSESFPLDGSLTFGIGLAAVGDFTRGYLPVGITLGRRVLIEGSDATLVPYLHAVLTPRFADADGTGFTLGFGADLRLTRGLDLRISAGLGDQDGISLSAAWLR